MLSIRAIILTLFLSAPAWAQINAVWVIKDFEIVGSTLQGYVGTKVYPVVSEADVRALSRVVRRAPKPARWVYDKERGWMALQRRGYRMKVDEAVLAYRAARASGKSQFVIPVEEIEPSPSVLDWARRGVLGLIGEGVSNFWGSSRTRVRNIYTGAAKLNGAWIPRGAVFSFNRAVGPIDEDHGFLESLVIIGDATEKGVGGGICQVSTTTFRAAFFSGLPIVERHPHSYQLHYYRPLGLDATIYQPWRDLKFKNDTPGDILILTQIKGTRLYIRFFGTPDREVTWSGPALKDRKPPLEPREIVDETLEPGSRKQIDWAAAGVTATITRHVKYADGRARDDVFTSAYRPWGDVFLVGPKPPPVAPGRDEPAAPGELDPQVPLPPVIGEAAPKTPASSP